MTKDFITIRERFLYGDGQLLSNTYNTPVECTAVRLSDENGVPHIEDTDAVLTEEFSNIQFPVVVVPTYENDLISSVEIVIDSSDSKCELFLKEFKEIIDNPEEYYSACLSVSGSIGTFGMYLFELETFQNSSM